MTDKDLKKLRRQDLFELLLAQSKEVEDLKERLRQAEEKLQDRQIKLLQAGSIAEAALQLNGVFEAAEKAAAQWLENLQRTENLQETENFQESENRQEEIYDLKEEDIINEEETQTAGQLSNG